MARAGAPLILLAIAIALAIGFVVAIYNRLVTLRNRFRNAYSQIDVQLKRRYDLIPNLVEAVKGYMAHERQTLTAVIQARNAASAANAFASANPGNADALRGIASAEASLTSVLGRIKILAEAYPDLKANQNVAELMEQLSSTENRVAFARQAYNDAVMLYNIQTQKFPSSLIASIFNFDQAPLFEIQNEQERAPVAVSFGQT
jgi:LemA protein